MLRYQLNFLQRQEHIDAYLKGVFKKGLSDSSLDSADSDEKESMDTDADDMSAAEFDEFKDWLAADQPNETPRKPPRKVPTLAISDAAVEIDKTMKVAVEGFCPKCSKASTQCTSDGRSGSNCWDSCIRLSDLFRCSSYVS